MALRDHVYPKLGPMRDNITEEFKVIGNSITSSEALASALRWKGSYLAINQV